jgi:bleomycin hydrolase
MSKLLTASIITLALLLLTAGLSAQSDKVKYVPDYKDPANKELGDIADSLADLQDSLTGLIRDRQEEFDKMEKDQRERLRFEFTDVVGPASPDDFEIQFHYPPVRQYSTGTCWSFSATSYFESEVYRLTGKKIKLSVMHTVYYEYIEKARYFIQQRGKRWAGQGSETNAVTRMMKLYGAVPYDEYPGFVGDERHDHSYVSKEVRAYLNHLKKGNLWDEDAAIAHIKIILNRYLGEPPTEFQYDGKTVTPKQFLDEVLTLNPDDYFSVMSTLSEPFYEQGLFEVPDNWWFDSSYYNLPLDEWYDVIVEAIDNGYTVTIGGDNSGPGWQGFEDVCVIPDFDIPQSYINQDSRELRFYNETTTDDHGIHLVGHTKIDGRDWFLIKDSGSSGHWGKHKGYYFMRDDYIRLKMLTFTVHKDMMKNILPKFSSSSAEE